jgi:hypothetical protein
MLHEWNGEESLYTLGCPDGNGCIFFVCCRTAGFLGGFSDLAFQF